MKRMLIISEVLILAAMLASAAPVRAHDARPLFVEITETGEGIYALAWRAPPSVAPEQAPRVSLDGCAPAAVGAADQPRSPARAQPGAAVFDCSALEDPPALMIAYGLYNPSLTTLVRLQFEGGETHSMSLAPSVSRWTLPASPTFSSVAQSYFVIGVEHIWGGPDHLLFLAGLLLIARTPRRVLVTVTGFTLAHSLTIFLVALDMVRISVPAVETVIALSVVFLAAEIARDERTTLDWRRPVIVSAAFGLVHGAGFAAALDEIGLPQTETIAALVFFNLGVEAGQVVVIVAAFAVIEASRRLGAEALIVSRAPGLGAKVRPALAYGLGVLSAFWFVERLAGAFA